MKFRITAALAATTATCLGVANASTLVFEEDFEGTQIDQSWQVFDTFGQFSTIEGAGIEVQRDGTVVHTPDGQQYIELDSDKSKGGDADAATTNTSMAAVVNLVEGAMHTLTFLYQPRTNNADDNGIAVSIGDLDITDTDRTFTSSMDLGSVDGTREESGGWQLITLTFLAAAGDNAIMFSAFGNDNTLGGFIDDVKIYADMGSVPLPAGGLLLGTGLIALARCRRA